MPFLLPLFPPKHHRPRLPRIPPSSLQLGRMHPRLLRPAHALLGHILHPIALLTRKLPRGELACTFRRWLVRGDFRGRFGNDPVLGAARDFVGADLDEAAAFDGEEMAGWENFDVDDGEDAVVDVVGVDFACDDLFTFVVHFFGDVFVNDGW